MLFIDPRNARFVICELRLVCKDVFSKMEIMKLGPFSFIGESSSFADSSKLVKNPKKVELLKQMRIGFVNYTFFHSLKINKETCPFLKELTVDTSLEGLGANFFVDRWKKLKQDLPHSALLKIIACVRRPSRFSKATILENCIIERDEQALTLLIENGYPWRESGALNITFLHMRPGDYSIIKALFRFITADTDIPFDEAWAVSIDGKTMDLRWLLHFDLEITRDIVSNHIKSPRPKALGLLKMWLEFRKHFKKRDEQAFVASLVRSDIDLNFNFMSSTLLIESTRAFGIGVVKLCLEKGANINQSDKQLKSVLMYAVEMNNLSLVRFLVENGADVNHLDCYRNSALLKASGLRHDDIALYLLDSGAYPHHANVAGVTPFLCACKNGLYDLVKRLLQLGAGINQVERFGTSGYAAALQQSHKNVTKLLIEKGARVQ